jgi:Transcriptional regulator, contains sigma factor-related N-terminal domain
MNDPVAGTAMAETPRAAKRSFGDEVAARVVWYYYVGNLTQQEIGDRLGLTRLRVNKIIGQARMDGSVRIEVRLPLASCVALEEELAARYGLAEVAVVPAVPGYEDQQRVIGEAAGAMLSRLMADGQSIGIGWGRTLSASVASLGRRRLPASRVVSLMGGLTRGSGTNTFEVATRLAEAIGGECHYLAAPIYCPSEHSRNDLLTHYGLADVMRRARAVDIALVSCGDVSSHSLLATTQTVREYQHDLEALGTVGDLLGTFLDARGQPIPHRLNQCVMALSPQELKAVAHSILASGGLNKAPVVHAILTGGYVNRLVTDEDCARAILAMPLEKAP